MVSDRRIWTGLWVAAAVVLVLFMLAFWPVMRGRLDAAKQLQAEAAGADLDLVPDDEPFQHVVRVETDADAVEIIGDGRLGDVHTPEAGIQRHRSKGVPTLPRGRLRASRGQQHRHAPSIQHCFSPVHVD